MLSVAAFFHLLYSHSLVDPYEGMEALTPGQIQYLLDEGAKRRQKTAS